MTQSSRCLDRNYSVLLIHSSDLQLSHTPNESVIGIVRVVRDVGFVESVVRVGFITWQRVRVVLAVVVGFLYFVKSEASLQWEKGG